MRFSDLESYLARTPLAPLWVITGEEPLLMLEAADLLRAKAREEGATEREVLNASALWDWSKLPESCTAMSLFGDKKIVELRRKRSPTSPRCRWTASLSSSPFPTTGA